MSANSQNLSSEESQRYGRQLILEEIGVEGQKKLKSSRVLLVGAGGLGSPLASYLAAAGVGTLGIVEFDNVELSNLHRQLLHGSSDLGRPKLDSAIDRLREINPHVNVEAHAFRFDASNARELVKAYDIVADGSDNFATRYLVNDACVLENTPNAYGAVFKFEGQASLFVSEDGPCYRCLYPEPPPPGMVPSCAEGGVLGILPGIIGLIQANEVIKAILNIGTSLKGRLLLFDARKTSFREITLKKNHKCPVCGDSPTITELKEYEGYCGIEESVKNVSGDLPFDMSVQELAQRRSEGTAPLVIDVRTPVELQIASIESTLDIPMQEIATRIGELNSEIELAIFCHHGNRSGAVANWLREQGFGKARNIVGGIESWSREIDSTVPRY